MRLLRQNETAGKKGVILFFTGWGMDPAATAHLAAGDYEVHTFWDYTELPAALPAALPRDREVHLVAFSLGVWAAAQLPWEPGLLQSALALNGTTEPRSEKTGIPPAVFDGTAENWLMPRARERFLFRMTGSLPTAQAFSYGTRTPEGQQRELRAIASACQRAAAPQGCPYTRALVGTRDRIFPPQAQRLAWENAGVAITERELPHHCLATLNSWEEVLRLA